MADKKRNEENQDKEEKKFGLIAEEIEEVEEAKKNEAEDEFGDFDEGEEEVEDFGFIPQTKPLSLESMFEEKGKEEPEEKKKEEKEEDKYKAKADEDDSRNYKKLEPIEARRIEMPEFARKSRGRGTREVFIEKIKEIEGMGEKKEAYVDEETIQIKHGKRVSADRKFKQVEGLFEGEMEKEDYDVKELKKLIKESSSEKEKS